jgi:Fe2+ transport system protein FeoA
MKYQQELPLAMVGLGQTVKLTEMIGKDKLTRRLIDLGLTPGVELRVIQNQDGRLILAVRGSRVVLGQGMAHKIMVQPIIEDVVSLPTSSFNPHHPQMEASGC